MFKYQLVRSSAFAAALSLIVLQSAWAGGTTLHDDESPLESLIPTSLRARIDARKEVSTQSAGFGEFNGSRSVDLRDRDTGVKQQFSAKKCAGLIHSKVGTCSAFGLTAALENLLGGGVNLSERQLWSQYCVPSSSAELKAMSQGRGMIEEDYWPEKSLHAPSDYSKAARFKVLEYRSLEDNLVAMAEALDAGQPLYFAMNTPSEMYYDRKAYTSAGSGNTGGGHAVAVVGYKLDESVEGGGWLLIKNSWGVNNGENGYNWLAMGYCKRKGNYCSAWSIDRAGQQ